MTIAGAVLPAFVAGVLVGIVLECAGMPRFVWTATGAAACFIGWARARTLMVSPRARRVWWLATFMLVGGIAGTVAVTRIDALAVSSIAAHSGDTVRIEADVIRVAPTSDGVRLTLGRIRVVGFGERLGRVEAQSSARVTPAEGDRIDLLVELWPVPKQMNPSDPDWSVPMLARGVHASGRVVGSVRVVRNAGRGLLLRASHWLRAVQAQAVAILPQEQAGVLSGLMLGDSSQLPPDVDDAFTAAGVAHLLAASGLHLGVVYSIVDSALRRSRLPKWAVCLPVLVASMVYAGAVGLKASIVRALIVACLASVGVLVGRAPSPLQLVCFGVSVQVLAQPVLVWDAGFRLSYAAFSTVVTVPRLFRCAAAQSVAGAVISSTAVSLVTWPITVGFAGKVNLLGPVVNIVAIPLATLALVGGLVGSLIYAIIPWTGAFVVRGAGILASLLTVFVRFSAGMPFSQVSVAPLSAMEALLYYACLVIAAYAGSHPVRAARLIRVAKRHRWRCVAAGVVLVVAFAMPGPLRITVLSVGQGDATLIRSPGGACVLVDTGTEYAGSKVLVPFLARQGIRRIDLVVVTHEHADHAGGLAAVAQAARIGALAVGHGVPQQKVNEMLAAATTRGKAPTLVVVGRGQTLQVRDVRLEVMHPDQLPFPDPNARSMVLHVECKGATCLMCADVGKSFEEWIVAATEPTDVDLLKVAHHASASSSSLEFLQHVSPRWAAISVGRNSYGHPSEATVGRLAEAGAVALRTDVNGAVELTTMWPSGKPIVTTYGDRRAKMPLFRRLRTITK